MSDGRYYLLVSDMQRWQTLGRMPAVPLFGMFTTFNKITRKKRANNALPLEFVEVACDLKACHRSHGVL